MSGRMNRDKVKHSSSGFYPQDYSINELKAIARGMGSEAWSFAMNRPIAPPDKRMATLELARRHRREGGVF